MENGIKDKIKGLVGDALKELNIEFDGSQIELETPKDDFRGDFSTNIAMRLASSIGKSPVDLAKDITSKIVEDEDIEKVEFAPPGFINFFISKLFLSKEIKEIANRPDSYFKIDEKKGERVVIEFTDANLFKVFHIGHLYTNAVGESLARLQETLGVDVKRATYQGDVGLHVAKTLWGFEKKLVEEGKEFTDIEKLPVKERVGYLADAYVVGTQAYDEAKDLVAREEIDDINYYIFSLFLSDLPEKDFSEYEKKDLKGKYEKGREWCLEYFETIYKRVGTRFDYYFFESEIGEYGLKLALDNVGKIFKKDDGAVIYEGDEEKNLHTRVFVNKYGLPTYEAKELGLAFKKKENVGYDRSIIITANEQSGYFKVVMDALSKLDEDIAKNTQHISHGMVKLPGASKMSSRKGGVISAEWLLNETKKKVLEVMRNSEHSKDLDIEEVSERVALGAIKYAFLKVGVGGNIIFDFEQSISFDGDTGPYIQYVYSRCNSLLEDMKIDSAEEIKELGILENPYVLGLSRLLSKYGESLLNSAKISSPSILCQYLFDLSQKFNSFYQNVKISSSSGEEKILLLLLVRATMNIVQDGLNKLGIEVVERM